MPVRFRKSIGVGKGMRLNVGKRGISSASIKSPLGTSLNVGKRGVRQTASIPGTGISITSGGKGRKRSAAAAETGYVAQADAPRSSWTTPNKWSAIGVLIILAIIVIALVAG
jgi:hypothetical protein